MWNYLKSLHDIPETPNDLNAFMEGFADWEKEYKSKYLFFYLIEEEIPYQIDKIWSRLFNLHWTLSNRLIRKPNIVKTNLDSDYLEEPFITASYAVFQVLVDSIEIDVIDDNVLCRRDGNKGKQIILNYIKEGQETGADETWLTNQETALNNLIRIYDWYKSNEGSILNYEQSKQYAKEVLEDFWALSHLTY